MNIYRHGEIMLVSVAKLPLEAQRVQHSSYVIGHSETGHHHEIVAERGQQFDVIIKDDELFLALTQPTRLIHRKATDKHRTLTIQPGIYKRFHDTEYNPFEKIIEEVRD